MRVIKQQKGVTLLELMIALAISTIFVLIAATMMARNFNSFRPVQEGARLNDGTRSTFNFLTNSIRQAGYMGSSGALLGYKIKPFIMDGEQGFINAANPNDVNGSLFGFNLGESQAYPAGINYIEGADGSVSSPTWQPSGGTQFHDGSAINAIIAEGTDAITIRAAGLPSEAVPLDAAATEINVDNNGVIALDPTQELRKSGAYIISNGEYSELFIGEYDEGTGVLKVDNTQHVLDTTGTYFQHADHYFDANATTTVTPTTFVRYYIAEYSDVVGVSRGLFREIIDDNGMASTQIIFPGVMDMQITYGVSNGVQIEYFAANDMAAASWPSVELVKIGLLVKSASAIGIAPDSAADYTVDVNGTTYTETNVKDAYVRRVYDLIIPLRNEL